MRITLPADAESAIAEMGALAALLDKNGWKAAAFIAVSVKPDAGHGGRQTATSGRLSATAFAKAINARGWSKTVVMRHFTAWEAAAADGLVTPAAELIYGERIEVPADSWTSFYPPEWTGQGTPEAIAAQAREDGVGPSKAVDIGKNTAAMASAIKASPKVAAAAAKALVSRPEVVVDQIMETSPRNQDAIFHELKLRRAGVDTSEANRKAADAWAHKQVEPIREAMARSDVELCILALEEAKTCLADAISGNGLTEAGMARVNAAFEAFSFTLTEARFAVS